MNVSWQLRQKRIHRRAFKKPTARMLHVLESTTGGVRRYVTALTGLRREGWDIAVACPAIRETHFGDVEFVDDMRRLGVPVYLLPLKRSIGWADLAAARELHRLLRHEHFDLIHTHSSKAGFLGRLIAQLNHIPTVHTPNGLYFLEQRGVKRWFYLLLELLAGRITDQMVAVSEDERDVILRYKIVSPQRVHVIENAVDVRSLRAQMQGDDAQRFRYLLGQMGEGPIIGGVGRMVAQKDPFLFVRAAQRVRDVIPSARFAWAGDGELREPVKMLAQQLHVPLLLTGHIENVRALLSQMHVFVLPSRYEGLPFALLEAMALNVPVVATGVLGTRNILCDESTGHLVASGDEAALAHAIVDVLSQPDDTRRRVKAAQELIETRFSIDQMLLTHQALYSRMAATGIRKKVVQ